MVWRYPAPMRRRRWVAKRSGTGLSSPGPLPFNVAPKALLHSAGPSGAMSGAGREGLRRCHFVSRAWLWTSVSSDAVAWNGMAVSRMAAAPPRFYRQHRVRHGRGLFAQRKARSWA